LVWATGAEGLRFYTSGINSFVDVRDVAKSMIQLMDGNHFGERFIITSESLPYRQIFTWISTFLGKKPPSIPVTPLMGEIAFTFIPVEQSLADTCKVFLSEMNQ